MRVCMHAYMCVNVCVRICGCMYVCVHVCMCMCTFVCVCVCVYDAGPFFLRVLSSDNILLAPVILMCVSWARIYVFHRGNSSRATSSWESRRVFVSRFLTHLVKCYWTCFFQKIKKITSRQENFFRSLATFDSWRFIGYSTCIIFV